MKEDKIAPGIPVALVHCPDYGSPGLPALVGSLLETVGWHSPRGARVLVKPNLLAAKPPDFLPCTHPRVVRAACEYLLDLGATVTVGDSPTFGTGPAVAQKIGLTQALAGLPVSITDLNRPRLVRLSFPWGRVALSRRALESEVILNLPKLKVHRMMAVTGAVKNHFGCVTSLWKVLLHVLHGDRENRFERMLLDLLDLLPPSVSVMDAVTAMHVTGPVDGSPFPLGLLAASPSPVALDTAVYALLGLRPANVPLWQEALNRSLPGVKVGDLAYPLAPPDSFDARGFKVPATLQPLGFHPLRLVKHLLRNGRSAWFTKKSP